jgi:hypothetical protein
MFPAFLLVIADLMSLLVGHMQIMDLLRRTGVLDRCKQVTFVAITPHASTTTAVSSVPSVLNV